MLGALTLIKTTAHRISRYQKGSLLFRLIYLWGAYIRMKAFCSRLIVSYPMLNINIFFIKNHCKTALRVISKTKEKAGKNWPICLLHRIHKLILYWYFHILIKTNVLGLMYIKQRVIKLKRIYLV